MIGGQYLLQAFCKRGQGLVDWQIALGSCWTSNTRLPIWFLPHKEHQPTHIFMLRHVLATAKKGKRKVYSAFWTTLLPMTVFQERSFEDKYPRFHNIEVHHSNHVHKMPLPSYHWWQQTEFMRRRLERGLPSESPSILSLITMTWTSSRLCKVAGTALDSVQTPSSRLCMLMILLSSTPNTVEVYSSNWTNSMTSIHVLKGLRWTLTRQKSGFFFSRDTSAIPTITYDGTPQRLVTQILESLSLVMEVCTQPLKIWQATLGLP